MTRSAVLVLGIVLGVIGAGFSRSSVKADAAQTPHFSTLCIQVDGALYRILEFKGEWIKASIPTVGPTPSWINLGVAKIVRELPADTPACKI